jgi:hypothetical protein
MEEFNKKGFPIIKLHDDHFEVKAIDYCEYRTFNYSEVVRIEYDDSSDKFWGWPVVRLLMSRFGPYKLKLYKQNGADWSYDSPTNHDKEFELFTQKIKARCGLNDSH